MSLPDPTEYASLPKYLIRTEGTWPESIECADDPEVAKSRAESMAQDSPGKFVAIYQRMVLIRTHPDEETPT